MTAISLRPVSASDLATIDGWAAAIGGDAPSRTRPLAAGADRHDPASGLFLGNTAHFGRGIGQTALRLAITEFRRAHPGESISLHVRDSNERAVRCYRAVGFEIVDTGSKVLPSGERVAFHTMTLACRP